METLTTRPGWLRELPGRADVRLLAGAHPDPDGARALEAAVVEAFPEYRLGSYFAARPQVIAGADHVVVARHAGDDRVLGLVVARHRSGAMSGYLHVEMNLIVQERQRRGLLLTLWRAMLDRLVADSRGVPDLVALKTYNPMAYSSLALVARLTGASLYPALDGPGPAPWPVVAAAVAADVAPRLPFDPATGVLTGAGVPVDFYPSLPTTTKRDVQAYFARHLAPGDRLLCLLWLGPGVDLSRLLRRLGVRDLAPPAAPEPPSPDRLSEEASDHA